MKNIIDMEPWLNRSELEVWSHLDNPHPQEVVDLLLKPHKSSYYFLMFINRGSVEFSVDLRTVRVNEGQALFIKPQQVRMPPASKGEAEYFKILFSEQTYSLLPLTFKFWLDPIQQQKISFTADAWERMNQVILLLRQTLQKDAGIALSHSYLQSVLTEMEESYFSNVSAQYNGRYVQPFLRFQHLVEEQFMTPLSVAAIAKQLAMSESNLYSVVKEWSGISPKKYINQRIALEAQRRLLYAGESVKELATRLGFSDENYLSRFFRKQTGQSISEFRHKFAELSR